MAETVVFQNIDVVFETLRAHVDDMTPQQQMAFTQQVMSLTPAVSSSPRTSEASDTPSPPRHPMSAHLAARQKSARAKALKIRSLKGKKPVNAFMAFRAYISPELNGIPQKLRSPMLSEMWRAEKRQHLFHLLGSAFSKIRDLCSNPPSLDQFLQVASNVISVIPAKSYFALSGWTIVDDGMSKKLVKVAIDEAAVTSRYPLQTNASPQSIIRYCLNQGLISSMPQPIVAARPHPGPTMSFAALPQNLDLATLEQPQTAASTNMSSDDISTFFNFNDFPASSEYSPSMHNVAIEQQLVMQNHPAVAHWHPAVQPPLLNFDPNTIQDDFDPFSFDINFATHI